MVPEGGKTFSKTNFRNILKVIHMTEGRGIYTTSKTRLDCAGPFPHVYHKHAINLSNEEAPVEEEHGNLYT